MYLYICMYIYIKITFVCVVIYATCKSERPSVNQPGTLRGCDSTGRTKSGWPLMGG